MLHRASVPLSSPLLCGQHRYFLRYCRTFARTEQPSLRRRRGLGCRFEKPITSKTPLEDILMPQRVPLERYMDVEFEGVQAKLSRQFISTTLDQFANQTHIRELANEQNIKGRLFDKSYQSFRLLCCSENASPQSMEPALRIALSDIKNQEQSVDSLYPFFVKHARSVFPHLECLKELKAISDLTQPHNWYPLAREIRRKIVFHAGPTNSGKTYEALEYFKRAKSATYCGPLRLLAFEVFKKMNEAGTPCDMVTGENRLFAFDSDNPAAHLSVTVEMLSPEHRTELCVIDEIQMLRDPLRGGAWTKALLGAAADEVHLCGEESAYDIICRLLDPVGEHVNFRRYERKGELIVIGTHGLRDLSSVQDGDCVIHFSKKGIIEMARQLKSQQKRECAIVFGDLPPEVKQEQVKRFNDPSDPCKILLATDAIGMGMNLNIKRVIFTTLKSRENTLLPAYFVKQIAGRAGRYASAYCTGEVMTLTDGDAKVLEKLMREPIKPIDQAGISPSFDQIEMFSFHLPQYSLVQLLDIFTSICTVNDDYFLCLDDSIRQIALLIGHIQLSIRERYIFCFTPIGTGPHPFLNSSFVKMVRRYAEGSAITIAWVRQLVVPELKVVNQIEAVNALVDVYDFMGAYLWLSYRFEEHFCDRSSVRELQKECGRIIQESIQKMLAENEKKAKEMPTLTLGDRREEPAVLEESELRLLKKPLPGKRVVVHKVQKVGLQGTFTTLITNMRKSRKTVI
uniref:RNA helicase n=1 Tax=Globodera rostochiensis TaxID=31243 RepID=A0A914HUC4_GLORO